MQLKLHESYVLPTLINTKAVIKLSETQIANLNACWNTVYRRISILTVGKRLSVLFNRAINQIYSQRRHLFFESR